MDPTSLWNRHCIQPWCSHLCPAHRGGTAFTAPSPPQGHTESTPSIFMAGTHTRAALQGPVRSRAGCSTPDTAWEADKSPLSPCAASSPLHPVHTLIFILATLTEPVQAPVTEVVRTVRVVDAQGSSPGSVSGQDLGTHSPQKASKWLYPPSFH